MASLRDIVKKGESVANTPFRGSSINLETGDLNPLDSAKFSNKSRQQIREENRIKEEEERKSKGQELIDKHKSIYTPEMQEQMLSGLGMIKPTDLSKYSSYFSNIGTTKGMTDQAKYLTDVQQAQEQAGIEGIQQQSGTEAASAYSNLAQQGGASAGARERLGGQMGTQSLFAQQQQRRAGQLSRLGILSDDEKMKLDAMAKAGAIDLSQGNMNIAAGSAYTSGLGNMQGLMVKGGLAGLDLEKSIYGAEQLGQKL